KPGSDKLASIRHRLKFVLKLKEEFVCPICRGVVFNPQQNSCGHIYCFHCLQGLFSHKTTFILTQAVGASNHRSLSFRPDPTTKCFQQPTPESQTNVAVGFPCFISHNMLQTPQNALYVKDNTLFVKAKVDMTDKILSLN
uniref:TNF receptor-associated factor 5-like n=1 Tax=Neolamprologus brichardi TaxID=32507 RepID=A0A3Q4GNL2_NEOBR